MTNITLQSGHSHIPHELLERDHTENASWLLRVIVEGGERLIFDPVKMGSLVFTVARGKKDRVNQVGSQAINKKRWLPTFEKPPVSN